jgi:ABC-type polysaccharide/polyol phosphate transport system ATPase subunit
MKSTSIFKETILRVQNLNLIYRIPVHRNLTWRDTFTSFSKDPMGTLMPEQERLHILKNINFEIKRGERVGLIGVNGAGKTSLCRCISGMYRPTSGQIHLYEPLRAIFDTNVGIQPELTGRENAELLSRFLFPHKRDTRDIVQEAIDFSELGKFADIPYRLYSSGMQSRLYLSLLSTESTGLLVLDEVFDGADVFFREKISKRVMKLIESSGAALFVSHSFDHIRKVCDRVILLYQSEIVFDGAPDAGILTFQKLRPAASSKPSLFK